VKACAPSVPFIWSRETVYASSTEKGEIAVPADTILVLKARNKMI
jgi:hypothetical protein